MSTDRYDQIIERHRVRRVRDVAFALLLAAVTAFSLGAMRSAGRAGATAVSAAPACQIAPSC